MMLQELTTPVCIRPANAVPHLSSLITSPRLTLLLRHWEQIRGQRLMPGWQDLDPVEIAPALSLIWAWTYDRDTDRFTGRLAGEEIRSIIGCPIAGVPMEDLFERSSYAEIFTRHKNVVETPAIALEQGRVFHGNGRVGFGERLILPLARDGRHADMIIGATTYQLRSVAAAVSDEFTPCRLGGTETHFFPL